MWPAILGPTRRQVSKDDPHFVLPKLGYADWSELDQNDLVPFRALIASGVDGILTAHISADVIDKNYPVTISSAVVQGLLRQNLGFQGIIFTDDLTEMMGILQDSQGQRVRDRPEVAAKAYQAGNDMLIFGKIAEAEDDVFPERTVTQ